MILECILDLDFDLVHKVWTILKTSIAQYGKNQRNVFAENRKQNEMLYLPIYLNWPLPFWSCHEGEISWQRLEKSKVTPTCPGFSKQTFYKTFQTNIFKLYVKKFLI